LLLAGLRSEAFCADDYTRGQSGWALVPLSAHRARPRVFFSAEARGQPIRQ
jgi:hypothetical protein